MVLLMFLTMGYEVSGIWFYCFFYTPMSLGIRELAHRQGIGLSRITEDYGTSGWVWIICDHYRSGFVSCVCFFRVR